MASRKSADRFFDPFRKARREIHEAAKRLKREHAKATLHTHKKRIQKQLKLCRRAHKALGNIIEF